MSEEAVKIQKFPSDIEDTLQRLFKGHSEGFRRFGAGGYCLPTSYTEHVDALRRMPLRPDDVWIVTYPRSGTTLTQEIMWLLENNLDYDAALRIPLLKRFTFLEIFCFLHEQLEDPSLLSADDETKMILDRKPEYQTVEFAPSPRFFKSHLPLSLLPPKLLETCKVVYVARDPRDAAVSYYHLNRRIKLHDFVGDFKSFWDLFLQDAVPYAPYFSHLKEAWAQRDHPNMLFMFYEDIVKDKPAAIREIAKFFGREYSDVEVQKLSDHVGIERFRNNESINPSYLNTPTMVNMNAEGFIRKGETGGWRKDFDEEMQAQAQRWMQRHLSGTDLRIPPT